MPERLGIFIITLLVPQQADVEQFVQQLSVLARDDQTEDKVSHTAVLDLPRKTVELSLRLLCCCFRLLCFLGNTGEPHSKTVGLRLVGARQLRRAGPCPAGEAGTMASDSHLLPIDL